TMIDETHQFALVLGELAAERHRVEDALFEAGCDDALLVFRGPIPVLEFDRESPSLEAAVLSAMRNVAGSGIGATVLRIEPDDLVSAAEIARRASVSREAVRLWAAGERREGFPPSRA